LDSDLEQRWPEIPESDPVILYFGKFIPSKGVGEIMTLAPAIFSQVPDAWIIFVGFGSMREHLELMLSSMASGDKALHAQAALADDFAGHASPDVFFRKLTPGETRRVLITGMLEHDALSLLLPRADVALVPSKWKEAFGMVNVEALASGVLPISQYHSGLKDIVDHLISALPELEPVLHTSETGFFESLPVTIKKAIDFLYPSGTSDKYFRTGMARKFRKFAVAHYSWKGIGKRLLKKESQN
jgi:spore coat protein SA